MTTTSAGGRRSDGGLETLRGLACVLLVVFHAVGTNAETGLRLPDEHVLRRITEVFAYIRMPLFAAIAGFVYGLRPVRRGELVDFARGKARRLVGPWLVATTVFWIASTATGSGFATPLSEVWRIYADSYAHFWFLQAILWLFAFAALLDIAAPGQPRAVAIGGLVACAGLSLAGTLEHVPVFSIDGAAYLGPYFFAGLWLVRSGGRLADPWRWLALAVVCAGFGWQGHLLATIGVSSVDRQGAFALVVGLSAIAALFSLRFAIPALGWVGGYSFSIYLYHVLFIAVVRKLIAFVVDLPVGVDLVIAVAVGMCGPIVMHVVLAGRGPLSTLVLGVSGPRLDLNGARFRDRLTRVGSA